ncbi:hypothetical protein Tco_0732887 [Tanacetum coccineum]
MKGQILTFFHQDKSRAFDYPYYHEDIEIKKYYELPPLLHCSQPLNYILRLIYFTSNPQPDDKELSFEEVFKNLFRMGAENLSGMKQEEAKVEDCDEGNMDDVWDITSRT